MNWPWNYKLTDSKEVANGLCGLDPELISGYIDGLLGNAEKQQIAAHIRKCDSCKRICDSALAVRQILMNRPIADPPADLSTRISNAIVLDSMHRPKFRTYATSTIYAGAAVIAFLFVLFLANGHKVDDQHIAFRAPMLSEYGKSSAKRDKPESSNGRSGRTFVAISKVINAPVFRKSSLDRVAETRSIAKVAERSNTGTSVLDNYTSDVVIVEPRQRHQTSAALHAANQTSLEAHHSVKPAIANVLPMIPHNSDVVASSRVVSPSPTVTSAHVPTSAPQTAPVIAAPTVVASAPTSVPGPSDAVVRTLYHQQISEAQLVAYNPSHAVRDNVRSASPSEPIVSSKF